MEPAKKLHPGIIALIVIVLIGIAATAAIVINGAASKDTNTTPETTQTTQQTTETEQTQDTTDAATDTSAYKDGTYSATGTYSSPGGQESIELTVTIKDGVITDTSLVANADSGDAKNYQTKFTSAYKGLIVGKDVEEVSLSRVAGSSLTSNGFNRALQQIKTDAEA